MLQIALLGPLEVTRNGDLVRVPSGKTSELLARLALEAGLVVRTPRLIEDLWAGDAVGTSRNTLQSKMAKLRRALGEPQVVVTGDGGYALAVESTQVDALAVSDQAADATRLLQAGDHRAAADLCASTLSLYRGDVLQAAGDGDWVNPHKARLEELRMKLVETEFSARLELGDVGALIGDLEAAVAMYPFQERLWEVLITSLYLTGRQTDALATYQRIKGQLAEELGLDPGPGLRQLEQLILSQDSSLDGPPPPAGILGGAAGNLPSMTAELIGREADVAALSELLAHQRLVEVVGPGGIGKTALAIATGRDLASSKGVGEDGIWLARLEAASTAEDVVDTLIAALKVPGGEAALLERLKNSTAVVILDNCEHVLDAAASLAVRLLDAAPRLRVLCTSQVPLDIDGETVLELSPLPLSEAVALFTRRAAAQRLRPRSSETGGSVLDLCRSLDGLPLAIELAAARTKTLSIDDIIRRLDHRFTVLSDPASRKPERRRSLESTIRWSYELLFPDDQRGLWALATFAGGASLAAMEHVLSTLEVPTDATIDIVGRLAGRSLVIVDEAAATSASETSPSGSLTAVRYRLLDSIRAFALDAMADVGLSERASAAHAAWFAEAARVSTEEVRSGGQAASLSFTRTERANIDAALGWSTTHDPGLALDIVNGFGWAWVVLGDSRGAQRILTALEAAGDGGPARARASALLLAAWIEASTGRLEPASDHIAAASSLADAIDDVDLQARCCYYLAYVASHHGDFGQALELTDRARVLYDGLDRPWDQAANCLFAARAAISAGDQERSRQAVEQAQQWLQVVEDPWLHVRNDAVLGELARLQHRFHDAVRHLGRAAETSHRLGFQQTEAYQVTSLGRAQCQAGDYQTGTDTLELAVDKAEATGDVRLAALSRVHLGRALRAIGRSARARSALEAATAWHRDAGGGEQAALGECLLAAMDAEDRVPGAEERLRIALGQARHQDDAPVEVFALDALAGLAAEAGDIAAARDLLQEADRRMAAASHFITDLDRTDAKSVRELV